MSAEFRAPLIALAASIGLIGAYIAFGGLGYSPAQVADPCESRPEAVLSERDLFEAIALSALDGAACELGVSREELALSLADSRVTKSFAAAHGIDADDVNDAVRAGLERAVDDAQDADRIGTLEATILRTAARNAPVGPMIEALQALSGSDNVQDLLAQLAELTELDIPGLPSIEDLPGLEDLPDPSTLLP